MSLGQQLRSVVNEKRGVIVPGAFNALSAKIIAELGYEAIYITGAGVTNMHFAMPDLGYGMVLYANAALQSAVQGMQNALTVLRDEKALLESSGLVAPFAERQRLVGKNYWDDLEKRYS